MENHPIPQDITGFQFKLIGNMTVKQFAYLATGGVAGWICYLLPLPFLIKLPLALALVGLGAALAFVPIEGRPMDLMIKNFFKAVFSPTQYVYQKTGGQLLNNNPLPSKKNASPAADAKLDQKEMVFTQAAIQLQNTPFQQENTTPGPQPQIFSSPLTTNNAPPVNQPTSPLPTDEQNINAQEEKFKNAALVLEQELSEARGREAKEVAAGSQESKEAHLKVQELETNLRELMLQKQQLEETLLQLQKRMQDSGKSVYTPAVAKPESPKETQFVRSIPQNMTQKTGLLATSEFPNVITGIVKDPRGNPLTNILVEVKDLQGNAVRAFKTNPLGQFASATALSNGEYTISFEDPRGQNKFDAVKFKADGKVILPIEVVSVDQREELRRSLFN